MADDAYETTSGYTHLQNGKVVITFRYFEYKADFSRVLKEITLDVDAYTMPLARDIINSTIDRDENKYD